MRNILRAGDEPVPGYRLIEEIEGSAFAKTWRVRTPEGLDRSWKVIDLVVGNAAIETRTLGLLVRLRHTHLNTLTNFWNLDDGKSLIIESDRPTASLRDLLLERQRAGLSGLSHEEATCYLEQAAEGLDYLNRAQHDHNGQKVAIYHRSLRPECLLLFEEDGKPVCKVSDFGLSKPVTEEVAQHSQGLVNYDYDPPEFFEGQTTSTSDQYSLAIVYYELRTGHRPFQGSMLEQLQARLNNQPDLSRIEEPERSILRKALEREASQRYRKCSDLADHLKRGATPADSSSLASGYKPGDHHRAMGAPRPTSASTGSPGWRSTTAAAQSPTLATTSSSMSETPSPTTTPRFAPLPTLAPPPTMTPPPRSGPMFHRPGGNDPTRTPAPERPPADSAAPTTLTPAPAPTVSRPRKGKTDLRSIREQLGSTSFGIVDTDSGERKVPLMWSVVILSMTAFATVWLMRFLSL
jgi:serine/threonine protein kinase